MIKTNKIDNQPLVSVIMNCYNGEKYLREAIDSVYAQSYNNWEIIFWDNASIDQSKQIANSYDSRLNYYCSKTTTSLGEARNKALAKSNGEFIAFIDADDIWYPEKLEKQSRLFSDGIGLVYSNYNNLYSDGKEINGSIFYKFKRGNAFNQLLENNFIVLSTAVCPKIIIEEFKGFPHYSFAEEYDLFLKISNKYLIDYIAEPLAKYRYHENNSTFNNFDNQINEVLEIYNYWSNTKDTIILKIINNAISYEYFALSRRCLFHLNDKNKSKYFLEKAKSTNRNISYSLFNILLFLPMSWILYIRKFVLGLLNWLKF